MPHFVLGARDPWAPEALRYYAETARMGGADPAYCDSIMELANDFDAYRREHGDGDPEAGPHRKDNDAVLRAMTGDRALLYVYPDKKDLSK